MSAWISGLGWVSTAGMGCGKDRGPFDMTTDRLSPIDRKAVFDLPYKNFGRMDEYSRLGLAAVAFALRDAGLEQSETKRDIGLVAQTEYGCLWTDIDYYQSALPQRGTLASPNLFAYTLPNCFMGEAAIRFGLTGESYVINEPSGSGLSAVTFALAEIDAGASRTMICGCCDLGRPPLLEATADVAAGALFFVLEESTTGQRGCYGRLEQTADGQVTFNDKEVSDLSALARQCLQTKHRSL